MKEEWILPLLISSRNIFRTQNLERRRISLKRLKAIK